MSSHQFSRFQSKPKDYDSDEQLYTSYLFINSQMDVEKITAPKHIFFHLMRLSCIYALLWLETHVLKDPTRGYHLRQRLLSFTFRPSFERYLRNSYGYWSNRLEFEHQMRNQDSPSFSDEGYSNQRRTSDDHQSEVYTEEPSLHESEMEWYNPNTRRFEITDPAELDIQRRRRNECHLRHECRRQDESQQRHRDESQQRQHWNPPQYPQRQHWNPPQQQYFRPHQQHWNPPQQQYFRPHQQQQYFRPQQQQQYFRPHQHDPRFPLQHNFPHNHQSSELYSDDMHPNRQNESYDRDSDDDVCYPDEHDEDISNERYHHMSSNQNSGSSRSQRYSEDEFGYDQEPEFSDMESDEPDSFSDEFDERFHTHQQPRDVPNHFPKFTNFRGDVVNPERYFSQEQRQRQQQDSRLPPPYQPREAREAPQFQPREAREATQQSQQQSQFQQLQTWLKRPQNLRSFQQWCAKPDPETNFQVNPDKSSSDVRQTQIPQSQPREATKTQPQNMQSQHREPTQSQNPNRVFALNKVAQNFNDSTDAGSSSEEIKQILPKLGVQRLPLTNPIPVNLGTMPSILNSRQTVSPLEKTEIKTQNKNETKSTDTKAEPTSVKVDTASSSSVLGHNLSSNTPK